MLVNDRPAKILILGEARITHTQRWIAYFRDRGWTVRAVSFPPIPPGLDVEALSGAPLPRALRIILEAPRIGRILETFRPDITSALFLPDYGWLASLANAHPLIVSAWGSDVLLAPHKSRLHHKRIVKVVCAADHLLADAEILRNELVNLGAASDRISIIPLGVDDDMLAIGSNRRIESSRIVTVMHNRRLESIYRTETLIHAARQLAQESRLRFVVAGSGSLKSSFESLVLDFNIGDKVSFPGWLSPDELRHHLASTDIYVSCSESDGTSVSLLEAMAAGCYPIVTDLAANREWITSGENGMLFPIGDAAALAGMITRASEDPVGREKARNINQDIIRTRARWHDNMAEVEDIMARLIAKGA